MGGQPSALHLHLPRSGSVAPNAAIVLTGFVHGELTMTASVPVAFKIILGFGDDRIGWRTRYFLVRPIAGDWPAGPLTLTTTVGTFAVTIAATPDTTPPSFTSLSHPYTRSISHLRGRTEATVVEHGPFDDPDSPVILVTLHLATTTITGVAPEHHAASLIIQGDTDLDIRAITLADVAGNTRRIEHPTAATPPPAFHARAGTLAVEPDGSYLATSDGTADDGFARGHYLSTLPAPADLTMSATVERLDGALDKPIELAFHGGFFGVTSTAVFLYESATNWTGWLPLATPLAAKSFALRVVQRGQAVSGYVDGALAGSITLHAPPPAGPVGLFFKSAAGARTQIRFRDFTITPVTG